MRGQDGKLVKRNCLPSPHLRDLDLKILMNHALPRRRDDVTQDYIRPSVEYLRKAVEKVAALLLEKAGVVERRRDAG